jgi:sulfur carrier protein ThiS adenylyltransferase
MSLLAQGLRRYLSDDALDRLARARIGIAGAGGLGSNLAMLLVRSGVRHFVVVDGDRVEASNLNRQFYWPEDMGKPKVAVLRDRLLALEPSLSFDGRMEWLHPENAAAAFAGCDIAAEALDEAESKAGICSALLAAGFFVVAASGLCGYGLPPMRVRAVGDSFVCVGDFTSGLADGMPPLAPRVVQAAALQADVILARILTRSTSSGIKIAT